MRKCYILAILIALSTFLCGCKDKKDINLCVKCGNTATEWISATPEVCKILNEDFNHSSKLVSSVNVFYLCENCLKNSGIDIIEADSPWDKD